MFEDDMSLATKNWFLEFSKKIKERKMKIEYSIQTRVDVFENEDSKKIAKSLKDSGCKFIYFGIESGVQKILDRCKKGITINQAERAFKIAKKYKIRSMASIQFGLPGEDLKRFSTVKKTIKVLNEVLKPDEVAISYNCLYPGSPLAIEEGITPENYDNFVDAFAHNKIYTKTAHGSSSIHRKGLTPSVIEKIEKILDSELKIKRFEIETFYKV